MFLNIFDIFLPGGGGRWGGEKPGQCAGDGFEGSGLRAQSSGFRVAGWGVGFRVRDLGGWGPNSVLSVVHSALAKQKKEKAIIPDGPTPNPKSRTLNPTGVPRA